MTQEQELKVHCIWCDKTTGPTSDAVRRHLLACKKHPIYRALTVLRKVANNPAHGSPMQDLILEAREALDKIEHDCGPTVYDARFL